MWLVADGGGSTSALLSYLWKSLHISGMEEMIWLDFGVHFWIKLQINELLCFKFMLICFCCHGNKFKCNHLLNPSVWQVCFTPADVTSVWIQDWFSMPTINLFTSRQKTLPGVWLSGFWLLLKQTTFVFFCCFSYLQLEETAIFTHFYIFYICSDVLQTDYMINI